MHAFDTPGSVSLQLELPSGRVLVTTADEPRTTVEVVGLGRRGQEAVDDVEVTMEERLGRYVVRVERRDGLRWGPIQITWGGDIECRITCPPGSALDLSGGSTELRTDGELGDVAVRTASGDVHVESCGAIQAKTASGEIFVGAVANESSVVTVSGELTVERAGAGLTARSVSGDVAIGSIAAPASVTTTSGDVDVKTVSGGEVRVQSVSGDVRIGIAPGTRTWIDATSVSGSLESELELDDVPPDGTGEGSAVVPLRVKTVSGDVSFVRAAAAMSA